MQELFVVTTLSGCGDSFTVILSIGFTAVGFGFSLSVLN